jgi:hypothetical protein
MVAGMVAIEWGWLIEKFNGCYGLTDGCVCGIRACAFLYMVARRAPTYRPSPPD